MTRILEGKNAVVTGAGRGIGREIALALAHQGAQVVVNDLCGHFDGTGSDSKPADEVVREIKKSGGNAVANYDTVSNFDAAKNIIGTCVESFGNIDILVNVAGIVRRVTLHKMSEQEWDDVITVHLKGTFNCCRHSLESMRQQKNGRIINFTSDAWIQPGIGYGNYAAAKGGIVSLSRALATEGKRVGVTCNTIAPYAASRMATALISPEMVEAGYREGVVDERTYHEWMNPPSPEHITAIAVYLASEYTANVTGRVFGASRGRVAIYSEPEEVKGLYKDGVWTPEELVDLMPKTLTQNVS